MKISRIRVHREISEWKYEQIRLNKKHKIKGYMGNWTPPSHMRGKFYYNYTKNALLVKKLQIDEVIHEIRLLIYKKHTITTK